MQTITLTNKDHLENLNPEQQEAVTTTDGRVRIIAGPGTGKTRVLIHRLKHLICDNNVPAESILSVTFTNKAAREMHERAMDMLPFDAAPEISTFHGFGFHFLKKYAQCAGYPKPFQVMDRGDQVQLVDEIYKDLKISRFELPIPDMLEFISGLKSNLLYVKALECNMYDESVNDLQLDLDIAVDHVFLEYLKRQRQSYALDFDDMLNFTIYILKKEPKLLAQYQQKYRYIQVDEYQDVNNVQIELVDLLHQQHGNLCVVGDPDQTIYTWRGSDIRNINDFEERFPGGQTVTLKTNYRSATSIVDASNTLIRHNENREDKPLEPASQHPGMLKYCHSINIFDEARFITEVIQSLRKHNGASFSDIAVLYRINAISGRIESELLRRSIPYRIIKGVEFFNRQEVRDALAFLKLLAYDDDIAFDRVINKPSRGIGPARLREIKSYAKKYSISHIQALEELKTTSNFNRNDSIYNFISVIADIKTKISSVTTSHILQEVLFRSQYEEALYFDRNTERIENVRALAQLIRFLEKQYDGQLSLTDCLAELAIYAEDSNKEEDIDRVQLMTIHSAKGLEFPYVIVAGMNEDILPSSRAESEEDLEEERRLAYVAFTRAKHGLILSSPGGYSHNNLPLIPSRFIKEISSYYKEVKRPKSYFSL